MGRNVISDEEDELEVDEEGEPMEGDNINDRDPDDEDEEDEDGQDEYENDGFIVDDVEDEDVDEDEEREDSDEERRKKKKKRKKKEAEDLDEDDYELLRENDVNVPKGSKKFKRLKKARRDFDEEQFGLSDDEFDGGMKGSATAEEKLKRTLFGDDDVLKNYLVDICNVLGQPLEDIAEDEEPIEEEEDGDMGEEDEMADFIVEEDEEHGASVRRKKMKNKKSRHAPDVSSSALKEAIDIFGDVDELLLLRKQGLDSSEQKEGRLEDQFEPTVLSEKYMTEKDDQIRMTDIPERMQISEESTGTPPIDELSIIEESTWIFNQLINGAIPFIAMYRKEQCLSLLQDPEQHEVDDDQDKSEKAPTMKWHRVLWAIQDLDRKWLLLQKRKSGLQSHYNKRFEEESRRIYDETRLNLNQQLFESILKDLRGAESEREVDDVDAKFNLHFPPGEVGVDEGQYKRPKRRSQYSICNKAGLWEVASKFGYSAEQLGAHLSLEKMDDELEDAKETPEEIASNFTCAMFETPQAVLKGARHMAAVEISCEPSVKRCVRNIFMDNAVVSTSPTPDGKIAIDSFHQFAGVKWLREKPLTRFDDAQWLLIQKAEEEKLLQVTIKLPEKFLNKLIKECNDQYLSNGVSKSAQQWNEQRKLILHDALFGFLLPSMEKEARSLLASRAKNRLLLEYGKDLWNKVSVGPYQKKESDVSSDEETAPRVMACCWGPGKPATTFVMLDSSGEVLDVLYTAALTLRSQNVHDQQRKKNDQQRVLKFMTDHQPHVVVLGAVNLSCTRLKDDIYEIIFKMVEENPRDVGHEMDELSIVYGDESLPRLYENSRISTDQLPGQSGIVRRAVALGRYLQNPLAMVATLCGPGKEILSWKLNPMENFLTADEKYQVFLVCKDSEMRSSRHQNVQNLDPYYHEERSSIQSEQEKARKEKELAKKHFKPRMIVHPRFQNITADEAVEYLCDKEPGESIVRPSSRGPSYLTLTLKVYGGVYAHKEIVEGGKEHKDITSLLRIGKTLKIGEDTFEDLDEVMDRYVDPLVSHLKAMLSYRKFRKGTKSEVDKLLTIERQEYPMRIVYCFGISHEHPGTFILTYIRSTNPHHEYVGLYPKGFKFRKRMFEDIDRLVAYFQRHIDDPQNESAPSIRSVAAMVPMRSPAAGSSAGASTGSGWGGPTNEGSWRGQSSDRGQSSTPGSRTGRNDYRNSSSRDGHPSGAPRPYGGRGRGRGSYNSSRGHNEGQDSSYNGTPKRDSGNKKGEDGWGNFPGAKVQNSPGREAFPGGWGGSAGTQSGSGSGSGWQ
ncbi:Transcription elongation factor SPT6 [Gossypium arboreum]|uniref:Transcription elongation factor spt6 n=1 Tax=Gossypium arboreum TaxID=29729 RepID=A0A0B0N9E5_GOSAR|nr:Transcription elongation factor SPT6 [Gossypium arboreum]